MGKMCTKLYAVIYYVQFKNCTPKYAGISMQLLLTEACNSIGSIGSKDRKNVDGMGGCSFLRLRNLVLDL